MSGWAGEGYAVAAPDLFFRSGGSEAADFATLIGALQPDEVLADLAAAHAHLRALGATAIGITGFCLGGTITYRAACSAPRPAGRGAVLRRPHRPGARAGPDARCSSSSAARDEYIPTAGIEAVRAHHPDQVVVYPEAGHGFMRDGSSSYDEAAAADAWAKLLAFFGQHLR